MLKRQFFAAALAAAFCAAGAAAQNANNNATSGAARRTAPARTSPATQPAQETTPEQQPARSASAPRSPRAAGEAAQSRAVRETFDSLVDGIRRADAAAVTKLYWNSPQLVLFNNNGTVTKSWEQARSNRESLYAKVLDVKLDVRDVRVKTLGPSGAVVTCLWDQSQTAEGQPERATGRLTIVYQKVGADWKIVHTHTSPDKPSPSNLLPSERTPAVETTPPARPPAKP